MGRHPSQRNMSEEDWQKQLQDAIDPDDVGLVLDYNLYNPGEKAELIRWGVSWRSNWKAYNDLKSFTEEHGLEKHGKLDDPKFASWQERDFSLMHGNPITSEDGYVNYGIRYSASREQK